MLEIDYANNILKSNTKYQLTLTQIGELSEIKVSTLKKYKYRGHLEKAAWKNVNRLAALMIHIELITSIINSNLQNKEIQELVRKISNTKDLSLAKKALASKTINLNKLANYVGITNSTLGRYRKNPAKLANAQWNTVYNLARVAELLSELRNFEKLLNKKYEKILLK